MIRATEQLLTKLIKRWPLYDKLGFYSLTPIFVTCGAVFEYLCIHMRINGITYYSTERDKIFKREYFKYLLLNHPEAVENGQIKGKN